MNVFVLKQSLGRRHKQPLTSVYLQWHRRGGEFSKGRLKDVKTADYWLTLHFTDARLCTCEYSTTGGISLTEKPTHGEKHQQVTCFTTGSSGSLYSCLVVYSRWTIWAKTSHSSFGNKSDQHSSKAEFKRTESRFSPHLPKFILKCTQFIEFTSLSLMQWLCYSSFYLLTLTWIIVVKIKWQMHEYNN